MQIANIPGQHRAFANAACQWAVVRGGNQRKLVEEMRDRLFRMNDTAIAKLKNDTYSKQTTKSYYAIMLFRFYNGELGEE